MFFFLYFQIHFFSSSSSITFPVISFVFVFLSSSTLITFLVIYFVNNSNFMFIFPSNLSKIFILYVTKKSYILVITIGMSCDFKNCTKLINITLLARTGGLARNWRGRYNLANFSNCSILLQPKISKYFPYTTYAPHPMVTLLFEKWNTRSFT